MICWWHSSRGSEAAALDTQCWLWFLQPDHLNQAAIAAISDETNELWLSVASVWEMGIKVTLGCRCRNPYLVST